MNLLKFGLLVAVLAVLTIVFKMGTSDNEETVPASQDESVLQNTLNAAHKAADSMSR